MHCTAIIPAYNTAAYLSNCLISLQAQTYTDWDAVVVSDGSTDATVDVAESFSRRDPRISLLVLPTNRGVAGATAIGIEMARGPIITVVDSDDVALPHAFATVLPFFSKDPELGFAWSSFVTQQGRLGWSGPLPPGKTLYEALTVGGWWRAAHHRFLRKAVYMKSVRINPAIRQSSDFQLALVMAATGCGTLYIPVVTYRYTQRRPGSITSTDGSIRQRQATVEARVWVAQQLAR